VPEYWLFDPVARLVTPFVLTAGQYRDEPRGSGTVTSSVLPGFTAEAIDLFAMP
jgi:Uma2 family endonuclease